MSSGQDDPPAILRTQDNHAAAGLPSPQDPQRPGGANDGTLEQEDCVSASCNPSAGGAIQGQIAASSNTGTKRPRKSVKASLQAEGSSGNVPSASASTSASSAKKQVKRALKKSKKPEADALKNGEPAASPTFRLVVADDTLRSPAVSGGSTTFTGAPLEPREEVAPLGSAEHVGTTGSIVQPPNPPRKRGRKKAITTPSTTLLPQDDSSSVSVKEEQVTALPAIGSAPKKTKKVSKEQKTWKVVPNSRESLDLPRQSSGLQSVTDPASCQQNKVCSIPRIWTSGKTELSASFPILGPAKCVNGFSWTHSHTPFVVLDDAPRSTRPVDFVQLDTRSKDEFIFDLLGTRALVTVGGSAKTNIAQAFESIPVLPDAGSSTIPSISTSSKRVHFAEGTKADGEYPPPSAEGSSSIVTATLPPSPLVEDTSMALDTIHAVPEAPATSEPVDMPLCPSPPPPQETSDVSIVSDNSFGRIRQVLHHLDQGALELASHFKVTVPLDPGGDGETDARSSVEGEGGSLTQGPEGAVSGEVKQENRDPQVEADKPMDIDVDHNPLQAAASSPLSELSSEEEKEVEAWKAEDRMDVDVDQQNPTPSTSTPALSSKTWTSPCLPCGCGRNWAYLDCAEHGSAASLPSSMASPVTVDINELTGRPKRKAAAKTSIRIQDLAKQECPQPRRSRGEVKQEGSRVKAEEVEAVIANTAQPEVKNEPDMKGKGRDVESPAVSVKVKVAKQPRKGKANSNAVNKLNSSVSSKLSTLRKRKEGEEDGKEAVDAAPETESLPSPSPRKRRRKSAAKESSVAVPPPMTASSSPTSVPEPASKDGQLASAPAPALSSEGVVKNQPLENGASQPPHVNEVAGTSMANPSSLQHETEPQSASTCASGASSSEPVATANLPPSDIVMGEIGDSLAKDDPPPAGAISALPADIDPSPPSAPAETSASAEKSIGVCDPLPSLPAEIRALIDAYIAGTPLAIMASRARILELFSCSRPQLDLQEEYGFACLGLFKILGLEERILPSATISAKAASSAPVHVEWRFRVQWTSGGEDTLKHKHSGWELARPWWTIPQKELGQGTPTPCQSDATEVNAAQNAPIPPSALQSSSSAGVPSVPSQSTSQPAPAPKDEAEPFTAKDKEASLFEINTPQKYLHVRKSHSTYGVEHTLIESGFYSLVPESLLSLFASFLSNETFPSGWFCTACGKVNFQAAMRHRKCSSSRCSKDTTPTLSYAQELPDIRGVFSDSPSCLPFNDYAQDIRGSSTSWNNGMRTLGYHFDYKKTLPLPPPENTTSNLKIKTDTEAQTSISGEGSSTQAQDNPATAPTPARDTTKWVKHVYTCNLPHLQKAASELVRRMQTEVELRRPMGDGSNPFFERTHDLASPITGSNDEVVTGVSKEDVPACLVDAGKLLFKRATAYAEISKERMVISRLNALAWITAGTRKNQDILYAKKHPIAILCLGCDVIITLTPKEATSTTVVKTSTKKAGRRTSRKGKEPEIQPEVQLDMSTLIPFEDGEKPLNMENEKENQGEEEELPEGGLGAEGDGSSGGDNHAPLASSSSSSQFPSVALVTASKLPEDTVQVTMVHGDVLVLSGEDYVFSLKRSGCGILIFGSKAV